MEHGARERAEEQSRTEVTIKTEVEEAVQSTPYIDIEINVKYIKDEPGLVKLVKSEPALLVKEEVSEDGWQGASTSAIIGSTNVFASSADLGKILNVKEELGATDTGPTVPQHMSTPYTTKQNTSVATEGNTLACDGNDRIMFKKLKKESVKDKCRDAQHSKRWTRSELRAQSQLYRCDKCPKKYVNRRSVLMHCKQVHGKGPERRVYICDYCQKTFTIKSSVQHHITMVHASGSYKCSQCKKCFKCEQYLIRHTADVHTTHMQVCNVCRKSVRPSYLRQHILRMHSDKQLQCKVCGETLKSKQSLRQHLNDRHGQQCAGLEPHYICHYCQKSFTSKPILQNHITGVHASGFYKCSQCNKSFKCKQYLMSHSVKVHTARMQECNVCGKSVKPSNLTQHMRNVHSIQQQQWKTLKSKQSLHQDLNDYHGQQNAGSHAQNYTCDHCQKTFWRKPPLRQHIERVHGERIHPCGKCNKIFKCKNNLQLHETSIHGKAQHECELCRKLFTTRYLLRGHLRKTHRSSDIPLKPDLRPRAVPDLGLVAVDASAAASTSAQQHMVFVKEEPQVVFVKEEPADEELELGPVVFQRMDCKYPPYKEEPQLQ